MRHGDGKGEEKGEKGTLPFWGKGDATLLYNNDQTRLQFHSIFPSLQTLNTLKLDLHSLHALKASRG